VPGITFFVLVAVLDHPIIRPRRESQNENKFSLENATVGLDLARF
jgi:hypothetical protein